MNIKNGDETIIKIMMANAGENELHLCNNENICHFILINLK